MILRFEVPYLYDALRALVTHAADDSSNCPHLAQIYFALNDAGGSSLVAADSHRLAFWNAGGNGSAVGPVSGILAAGIGTRDAKKLIAFLKPHTKTTTLRAECVDLNFENGIAAVDGGAAFTHSFAPVITGSFPPVHQVIPKVSKHTVAGPVRHLTISPSLMIDACKSFEIAAASTLPAVQIFTDGEDTCAPIVFRCPEAKHLTIVVMPIAESGRGVALWGDHVPEFVIDAAKPKSKKGAAALSDTLTPPAQGSE